MTNPKGSFIPAGQENKHSAPHTVISAVIITRVEAGTKIAKDHIITTNQKSILAKA